MYPSVALRGELNYTLPLLLCDFRAQDDAISRLLQALCEHSPWRMGAVWVVNPLLHALYCVAVWHAPDRELSMLAEMTRQRPCLPGEDVPGGVFERGDVLWADDLAAHERLPRTAAAVRNGFRSALGVPLLSQGDPVGVLELLSRQRQPPDVEQIHTFSAVGAELGRLIGRQQAEEALRQSEMRFHTLAETVSDAVVIIDSTDTIVFVNPAAEQMFGYRRAEMIGEELTLLAPQWMRERHHRGLAACQRTGQPQMSSRAVELTGQHRDGREIPLEISFGEFGTSGHRYFTGIVRDISERKRTEQAPRRSAADSNEHQKAPPARLVESIRETAGGAPRSPEIGRQAIGALRSPRRAQYDLTPHETRVLALFVEGHNYKTAAARLGVSIHTISFHLRSIYDKLQVHSKTEAVARALREGLV